MKLKSSTLRTFTTLHTWVGLVAGFALFVAFYAGAITVFHHDLMVWQSPHAVEQPVLAEDQILDLGRAGNAEEDDVACFGDGARRLALLGALAHEIIDGRPVAMGEHGELISLGHDVLADAMAHEARADQSDLLLRHEAVLLFTRYGMRLGIDDHIMSVARGRRRQS